MGHGRGTGVALGVEIGVVVGVVVGVAVGVSVEVGDGPPPFVVRRMAPKLPTIVPVPTDGVIVGEGVDVAASVYLIVV